MRNSSTKYVLSVLLWAGLSSLGSQSSFEVKHLEVAMRMVGHTVLLESGDSTSLVLPIQKVDNTYLISFESPIYFDGDRLVVTVDSILKQAGIKQGYITEVQDCDTQEVVYSFEVSDDPANAMNPCRSRLQNRGCYRIRITLMDGNGLAPSKSDDQSLSGNQFILYSLPILGLGLLLFGAVMKMRSSPHDDKDIIHLGKYRFDPRNATLFIEEQREELTGKEAGLLLVLYRSVNRTVPREQILLEVWGDEGEYIGRTLDVFISRLRKKLDLDSGIQIKNIRGVGYKLIIV